MKSPDEVYLCNVMANVLELSQVLPDDNFFELGGHSLLAVLLTDQILAEADVRISLRELFDAPTPASLALIIQQKSKNSA
ncbi:phosphopantetheine-binding protein (plasmid) [Streptomyces sp. R39]|uniref:Phosphopantetheine-binding protein n=1 Tax=Streptomyces sp. R39 TaxID=3238631 RepID=A0AB39R8U2_9ACTN